MTSSRKIVFGNIPLTLGVEKVSFYYRDIRFAYEQKGIRILQFYEDEIRQKGAIVKSMVDAIIGEVEIKLMARKCEFIDVPVDRASAFLDANHLIGINRQARFVGLTCEDKLVSVMAYRVHRTHVEIVRSASLLNTVVRGSFQKLLTEVQRRHPDLKIRTLVDLRYADGHSLVKAGFVFVKIYMQYQYTDGKIRKDKRQFRVPAGTNEKEAARAQGWYRIWDAGKAVYELPPLNLEK